MTWTIEAVTADGSTELPSDAIDAFAAASGGGYLPGTSANIRFDRDAFKRLTGFQAQTHGPLSKRDLQRAAEAASPERAKALANCYRDFDYVMAATFLRICAAHALAVRTVR